VKTIRVFALLMSVAMGMACGYSSKTTPPSVGTKPAISQLSPNSAAAGGPAFALTVNGTSFNANAVINWNGAAQATTHISANQLMATISAANIQSSGTVSVTVTNPAQARGMYGGGTQAATSAAVDFNVN